LGREPYGCEPTPLGSARDARRVRAMTTTVIDGAYVVTMGGVTMDGARVEHPSGHVVVVDQHVTQVEAGPAPPATRAQADRVVDATGCLLTPGLVNTHHHLYQWATRGLAVDDTLFGWLTSLYPVWAGIDEEAVNVAAQGA